MKSIYLANPSGFSELNHQGLQFFKKKLIKYFQIWDPFIEGQALGKKIMFLQQDLLTSQSSQAYSEVIGQLALINTQIGRKNVELIKKSDLILAILDGADVDSGTASEIGYGFGIGKKIFGYRGDFRNCGDNLGSKINLQVEYFIHASGGDIFYSLEEFEKKIPLLLMENS